MLSLVHLIYMAGDKCMRQNACYLMLWSQICPLTGWHNLVLRLFPLQSPLLVSSGAC